MVNTLNLDGHISKKFNADLEELRSRLLEMGGTVEQQITDAIQSILEADSGLAEKVISVEIQVDEFEVALDKHCTLILARRQPAASDLRVVLGVVKITRDLERMGDEAERVASTAISLCESGESPRGYVELRHIGSLVNRMVREVLDAFVRFDVVQAVRVAQQDTVVDQEYRTAMRELATYMMEDPRSISRVMNVIWALRSLERIGDHARNIAEHIVYMVKGLDVRHQSLQEVERQLNVDLNDT